jgi:predicted GNAT family acetyltransferase
MMPPDERPILCSCETFKKRALVGIVNEGGKNRVEEKIIYGIVSVFTDLVYRGKGYASRMFSALLT